MALDAPTVAGLILGVLGLFGMSMMYKLSKIIWKSLVRDGQSLGAPVLVLTTAESPVESGHAETERDLKRDCLLHVSRPK